MGNHIGEWMDMYSDRKDTQVHRVCVIAPRDHSKSTTLRVKLLYDALFLKWRDKPLPVGCFLQARIWLHVVLKKYERI